MKVAIIPARGGSKRIPYKNIKNFSGKPMIAWSIETAFKSELFDKIIVSTDDDAIAKVAREYGAETPFVRPKELADDFTSSHEVIKHATQWLIDQEVSVDYVCCIYATAPFMRAFYLKKGHDRLVASNKSFAFSVTSFSFPIQRALRINPSGLVEAIWPENIKARSQDLGETYHDAGQFYWGRPDAFLKSVPLFSHESIPIVLPRFLAQDIDTMEDWKHAELMFNGLTTFEGGDINECCFSS